MDDTDFEAPPALCLARNLRIILRGSQKQYFIDSDDSFIDRQAVHWLCALLSDNFELEKTTLTIQVEYQQEYYEDNDIMDRVLQPSTFLRGLADVKVRGVERAYGKYVETQMKSRIPAENIWKMKEAFWNWCEYSNPKNEPVDGIGAEALDAINDCDVAAFKIEREKAMSQLAGRRLRSTQRVYQHDRTKGVKSTFRSRERPS